MCHDAEVKWVYAHTHGQKWGSVLDIGSRNVNGSVRWMFESWGAYWGIDIAPGDGVDEVADASVWVPPRQYELVMCLEVFEHTPVWRDIVRTMAKAMAPSGRAIITTACEPRAPHSGVDGGTLRRDEYYENVVPDEMWMVVAEAFGKPAFMDVTTDGDVRMVIGDELGDS